MTLMICSPSELEPQVFNVLRYLIEHRDRVVTKDELLEQLWPNQFISEVTLNHRVMAACRNLRQLLRPNPIWRPAGPRRKPWALCHILHGIFYVHQDLGPGIIINIGTLPFVAGLRSTHA